jgi:hypothetical protein
MKIGVRMIGGDFARRDALVAAARRRVIARLEASRAEREQIARTERATRWRDAEATKPRAR